MTRNEAMAALRDGSYKGLPTVALSNLVYDATDGDGEVWEDPEYEGIYHWRLGDETPDAWECREFEGERRALDDLIRTLLENDRIGGGQR